MKVTVFTSNQPRHMALVDHLAKRLGPVAAILECSTVHPGVVPDSFPSTPTMRDYFSGVMTAERHYFGGLRFSPASTSCLAIRSGDLNQLTRADLAPALASDAYVVFGASFIRGWLADFLVEHKALNIHMGLSPFYRGSSCNFWALFDDNPAMVGATIHLLSHGLDSGPIVRHAIPALVDEDAFHFTMKAVPAAFEALVRTVKEGKWRTQSLPEQDPELEIRYSRNSEFTDEVASDFLARKLTNRHLRIRLAEERELGLIDPLIYW